MEGVSWCMSQPLPAPRLALNRLGFRYVDAQLRTSRRFDAEGIRREHPELFEPFPQRRSSSHGAASSSPESNAEDDGQLRYWTSAMCSKSPHLFDFVVTVS